MSHTAVPVGHYVPLEYDDSIVRKIEIEVKKAIKAIGLNNCAVNVDMILKGEKIYIIEITGRVGANCLPELVEINFGIEYYKMIALMALSETPLALWNKRRNNIKAGYSKMIFSNDVNGIINSLSCDVNNDPDVREVTFLKK
ncbi:argininosuccinate lyase [Fusobacterium necrophorum subsp. necrophorum]|nr:argininosuccinate lyase [Fusobacterium necrophorum subsp. necrophorum]